MGKRVTEWDSDVDVLANILELKAKLEKDTGIRRPDKWEMPRWMYNMIAPGEPDPTDEPYIVVDNHVDE